MKKIRINELARELEVKPGAILDLLPELGVAEKKTHSSSVDEDVAELLRKRLAGSDVERYVHPPRGEEDYDEHTSETDEDSPKAEPAAVEPQQAPAVVAAPEKPVTPAAAEHVAAQPVAPAAAEHVAAQPVAPPVATPAPTHHTPGSIVREAPHQPAGAPPVAEAPPAAPAIRRPLPIRPPLASPGGLRPPVAAAPSIPIPTRQPVHPAPPVAPVHPPVAPVPPVAHPSAPAAAAHPAPAQPVAPAAPGAPVAPPAHPVPAAPVAHPAPAPPVAPPAAPAAPQAPAAHAAPAAPAVPAPAPAVPARPALPAQPRPAAPGAVRPGAPAQRPLSAGLPPQRPSMPVQPAPHAGPRPPAAPPARNVPLGAQHGPRPGTILSGPRQPLPGGEAPRSPILPGAPRPHVAPAAPQRPSPSQAQGGPQGSAGQSGHPLRPTLAGQPAARPVVPPRPDLVARLSQFQAKPAPGQPAAPRPGMPTPGRPLYQGPRPGQPVGPRPGGPGYPAGPGRGPMRGRGPHPTSPVLEPPAPVTDAGRRDAAKKRTQQHDRERDSEGKLRSFGPRKQETAPLPVIDREITISEGITVKEFADKLGVKASLVIKTLFQRKVFATINQTLDVKMAMDLAREFGAKTSKMSYEEEAVQSIGETEAEGDLESRPPIVTVMGHVDHGKTSLLDAIRESNVAAREAGGITQHIGAYHVDIHGRKIVFIDTPGHEAFTRMRARGAQVTDIVVLVVAADDGVMPQTREAIDHAKVAKVPILVAVNKIDKPEAQPDRVKQQLTDLGLMPEDWGGDTPFVPVSAKKRQNIELLLEMILLLADMQELKANRSRPAVATVLEAQLDRGRGPVATCVVRNGTLRIGDFYICGSVFGKVRALYDDRGNQIKEAGPSMPVELLGLDSLPEIGDTLQVVTDLAKARQIAEFREMKAREAAMAKTRITLEKVQSQLREGEKKELNIIIKADVGGTAEVLSDTLQKLSNEKVSIRVLRAGVGAVTEADVMLAATSEAIVIAFNVRPDRKATDVADHEGVDIRFHSVIYELTDEIKKAMSGMLEPVFKEVYIGRAEVRETFRISKVGTVAGLYVLDGQLTRDCDVRVLRENIVIHTGRLSSLKRFKNDASEVKTGFECGASVTGFNDLNVGDIIEAFGKERVAQELFN